MIDKGDIISTLWYFQTGKEALNNMYIINAGGIEKEECFSQ